MCVWCLFVCFSIRIKETLQIKPPLTSHPFIPPCLFVCIFSCFTTVCQTSVQLLFLPSKQISLYQHSLAWLLFFCWNLLLHDNLSFKGLGLFVFFLLWSSSESFGCFNSLLVLSSKGETNRRIGSEACLQQIHNPLSGVSSVLVAIEREGAAPSWSVLLLVERERERESRVGGLMQQLPCCGCE